MKDENAQAAEDAAIAAEEAAEILRDLALDWGVEYDPRLSVGGRATEDTKDSDSDESPQHAPESPTSSFASAVVRRRL